MRKRKRDELYNDDARGAHVSSKPIETATRTTPRQGIQSQIQAAIRDAHFAQTLASDMQHRESFEEANDFNVGDDYSAEEDLYSDLDAPPTEDDGDHMERDFARALVGIFESAGLKFPKEDEGGSSPTPPKEGEAEPASASPRDKAGSQQ
jgi:hypothetical protein